MTGSIDPPSRVAGQLHGRTMQRQTSASTPGRNGNRLQSLAAQSPCAPCKHSSSSSGRRPPAICDKPEDLERASRPLMNGLPSSSAQGPEHSLLYLSLAQRSGRSFPGMPGLLPAASMPATPLGRSSSGAGAGGSGSFSNDPSLLQGLMSKMSRIKVRMQEDKARAYQSLEGPDGAGPPQPDDARPSTGGEAGMDDAAVDDSRDDDGAPQPELAHVSATPGSGSRQQREPVQVPQSASAPHQLQSRSSGGPPRQEIELREAAAPSPRVQQGPQDSQQATPAATAPADPGELL